MDEVWENEAEVQRELEDAAKKIDELGGTAQTLGARELKEEVKGCADMLKQAAQLLRKQKVDISFAAKVNGVLDTAKQEDLTQRHLQPSQQQHDRLKAQLDDIAQGKTPSPPQPDGARSEPSASASPSARSGTSPQPQDTARAALLNGAQMGLSNGQIEIEMVEKEAARQTATQILDTAVAIQHGGTDALRRAEQDMLGAQNIGNDVSRQLAAQNEDLLMISDDMDNLNAQITRARREVGQFSRRMATDKCFVCIFILILLLICTVVGIRIFNKKQDKNDKDEPLQFEDSPTVASALRLLSRL